MGVYGEFLGIPAVGEILNNVYSHTASICEYTYIHTKNKSLENKYKMFRKLSRHK